MYTPAYDYLFRLILDPVFSHPQLTSKASQIFLSILTQTPIYLSRTKALELQKVRTFAKTTILSNRYFPNKLPETTMAEWFECKIKYERTMDNGLVKKVNEPYLVDALNFTEAERRIIKEVAPFMSGEFQVSDIKRARFAEIFETNDDAADRWYKAKLSFITLDEKSGKEKKTSHNMLVQAGDLRDAVKRLGIDLASLNGAFLAPGVGAQGAGPAQVREVFAGAEDAVLASSSRAILRSGPSITGLRDAYRATVDSLQ